MVLAEEDALEAQLVHALPQRHAGVEDRCGDLGRDLLAEGARRIQELENPRLDHRVPRGKAQLARRLRAQPTLARLPAQASRAQAPAAALRFGTETHNYDIAYPVSLTTESVRVRLDLKF